VKKRRSGLENLPLLLLLLPTHPRSAPSSPYVNTEFGMENTKKRWREVEKEMEKDVRTDQASDALDDVDPLRRVIGEESLVDGLLLLLAKEEGRVAIVEMR